MAYTSVFQGTFMDGTGTSDPTLFSQPVQTNGMNGVHVELTVVSAGGTVAPTAVTAFAQVSNDLQNWTLLTAPAPSVSSYPGRAVATSTSGTSIANSAYVRIKVTLTGGTDPTAVVNAGVNIFNFST